MPVLEKRISQLSSKFCANRTRHRNFSASGVQYIGRLFF